MNLAAETATSRNVVRAFLQIARDNSDTRPLKTLDVIQSSASRNVAVLEAFRGETYRAEREAELLADLGRLLVDHQCPSLPGRYDRSDALGGTAYPRCPSVPARSLGSASQLPRAEDRQQQCVSPAGAFEARVTPLSRAISKKARTALREDSFSAARFIAAGPARSPIRNPRL